MRWSLCALVCCLALGLAGCTCKPTELANPDKIADMIVGTWEVTKSGSYWPEGATLEFGKDGKLKVTFKIDDQDNPTEWTYTVDGDKINLVGTLVDTEVNQVLSAKEVLKIKELTDTHLVTESATGESGIVIGYTYSSNINFKSVYINKPLRHGQKKFELVVGERTFPLEVGKRFFFTSVFPEGVPAFTIRGIDESEGLVYELGEIERARKPRPEADHPVGIHHRGSFPTGPSFMKEGKPEVMMVPILKQYPTEHKRK